MSVEERHLLKQNENRGLAKPLSFCSYPPRLFLLNAVPNLE